LSKRHRAEGRTQHLLSQVGFEVRRIFKGRWEYRSYKTLTACVSAMHKAGMVDYGGVPPQDWVSLVGAERLCGGEATGGEAGVCPPLEAAQEWVPPQAAKVAPAPINVATEKAVDDLQQQAPREPERSSGPNESKEPSRDQPGVQNGGDPKVAVVQPKAPQAKAVGQTVEQMEAELQQLQAALKEEEQQQQQRQQPQQPQLPPPRQSEQKMEASSDPIQKLALQMSSVPLASAPEPGGAAAHDPIGRLASQLGPAPHDHSTLPHPALPTLPAIAIPAPNLPPGCTASQGGIPAHRLPVNNEEAVDAAAMHVSQEGEALVDGCDVATLKDQLLEVVAVFNKLPSVALEAEIHRLTAAVLASSPASSGVPKKTGAKQNRPQRRDRRFDSENVGERGERFRTARDAPPSPLQGPTHRRKAAHGSYAAQGGQGGGEDTGEKGSLMGILRGYKGDSTSPPGRSVSE